MTGSDDYAATALPLEDGETDFFTDLATCLRAAFPRCPAHERALMVHHAELNSASGSLVVIAEGYARAEARHIHSTYDLIRSLRLPGLTFRDIRLLVAPQVEHMLAIWSEGGIQEDPVWAAMDKRCRNRTRRMNAISQVITAGEGRRSCRHLRRERQRIRVRLQEDNDAMLTLAREWHRAHGLTPGLWRGIVEDDEAQRSRLMASA